MGCSFPKDYTPQEGFVEDKRDPLIDLNLGDSTELWLIQWPINQHPDLGGLDASLNLKGDGNLGTLEDKSGISYDLVSSTFEDPQPMVIMPSSSEVKIVGKISRRVQLIHFHQPGEVLTQARRTSSSIALSSRRTPVPTHTIRPKDSPTKGGDSSGKKRPAAKSGSTGTNERTPSSNNRKRSKSASGSVGKKP